MCVKDSCSSVPKSSCQSQHPCFLQTLHPTSLLTERLTDLTRKVHLAASQRERARLQNPSCRCHHLLRPHFQARSLACGTGAPRMAGRLLNSTLSRWEGRKPRGIPLVVCWGDRHCTFSWAACGEATLHLHPFWWAPEPRQSRAALEPEVRGLKVGRTAMPRPGQSALR